MGSDGSVGAASTAFRRQAQLKAGNRNVSYGAAHCWADSARLPVGVDVSEHICGLPPQELVKLSAFRCLATGLIRRRPTLFPFHLLDSYRPRADDPGARISCRWRR